MRNILLAFLMFFAAFSAFGQEKDTIVIKMDNSLRVELIYSDIEKLDSYKSLRYIADTFAMSFEQVLPVMPEFSPYKVSFRLGGSIRINKMRDYAVYNFNGIGFEKDMLPNKCHLYPSIPQGCGASRDYYEVIIHFDDAGSLMDPVIQRAINSVLDSLPEKSKNQSNIYYNWENDKSVYQYRDEKPGGRSMNLSLNGGVGLMLAKSDMLLSFDVKLVGGIYSRNRMRHHFYLSESFYYIYDNEYKHHINAFVNLGYAYNFSGNKDKPSYMGLEAGYLVRRSGDFFAENTFRLGVVRRDAYFQTVAYVMFPGSIKKAYPAIGISYSF